MKTPKVKKKAILVARTHKTLFLSHTTCPLWVSYRGSTRLWTPAESSHGRECCHPASKGKKTRKGLTLAGNLLRPAVRSASSMQSWARTSDVACPTSGRPGNAIVACDRRRMSPRYSVKSMRDFAQCHVREDSFQGLCLASIHQYSFPKAEDC